MTIASGLLIKQASYLMTLSFKENKVGGFQGIQYESLGFSTSSFFQNVSFHREITSLEKGTYIAPLNPFSSDAFA